MLQGYLSTETVSGWLLAGTRLFKAALTWSRAQSNRLIGRKSAAQSYFLGSKPVPDSGPWRPLAPAHDEVAVRPGANFRHIALLT